MVEEEPGLLEDQQARLAAEPPLDLVEEVEQHGDRVLLALAHQVLDLEHLEAALAEPIALGVEQLAQRAFERVVAEACADLRILHRAREVCERAIGALDEPLERGVDLAPARGGGLDRLEAEEPFDPLGGPDANARLVDVCERAEREVARGVAGDVVVLAADRVAERERAVALVEREDLGARVAEELGGH